LAIPGLGDGAVNKLVNNVGKMGEKKKTSKLLRKPYIFYGNREH